LEEFEIEHRLEGFQEFFSRIEKHNPKQGYSVAVAMEGYNGYARPLDGMVRQRAWARTRAQIAYLACQWCAMKATEIARQLHRDASMVSRLCASYEAIRDPRTERKIAEVIDK